MPIATHPERSCRKTTVKKGDIERLRTVSLGRPSGPPHDDGVRDYCRNRVLVHTSDGGSCACSFARGATTCGMILRLVSGQLEDFAIVVSEKVATDAQPLC